MTRRERDNVLEIMQGIGYDWNLSILGEFSKQLATSIKLWEALKNGHIRYFCRPHSPELAQPEWSRYVAAIEMNIDELKLLLEDLDHQSKMLGELPGKVSHGST